MPRVRFCRRWITGAFVLLVIVSGALPGYHAPARAQNPCEGLVTPRLYVGGAARVTSSYGISVKNNPATGAAGATEVAQMAYGTVVTVDDGHRCNFGYVWWQVTLPNGTTGWAAEGDSADYFMEPATVGLHVFQRVHDDATGSDTLAHYFATPDGTAAADPALSFTVQPRATTPQQVWQEVEITYLGQGLASVRELCPDRLAGTPLDGITLEDALQLPLPSLDYDYYPAPDGTQLVLVRHFHLMLPRCDTVVPERVGISTVSLLSPGGEEMLLFPFPQHGSVPASEDRYSPTGQDAWNVYLSEVVWSPQGKYIAFVAAYRDRCSSQACYRFHLYVWNTTTGQLYILGEGRHVGWTNGGEGLNLFRLITAEDGRQVAHLYTLRADGANRQEIWLPGGAVYVSVEQEPLGLPWNVSGTHVMVFNAGYGEVMLFDVNDRTFTTPVFLPDLMPRANRLSVDLIKGEKQFLWTTIRGDFVTQSARTGDWTRLTSQVATTGVAPVRVRPFATGSMALVELIDGTAYVLDVDADRLIPVTFGP